MVSTCTSSLTTRTDLEGQRFHTLVLRLCADLHRNSDLGVVDLVPLNERPLDHGFEGLVRNDDGMRQAKPSEDGERTRMVTSTSLAWSWSMLVIRLNPRSRMI